MGSQYPAHAPAFDSWDHLETYYRGLRARGVNVDIVSPSRDLDSYAAVIGPALHLVDEDLASHLRTYVEDGGERLLTMRSGVKDRSNKLLNEPAPGPFADLVGATVDEYGTPHPKMDRNIEYGEETFKYRTWNERVIAEGATAVGTYRNGAQAGHHAITVNAVGNGHVRYCGVWPESSLVDALVFDLLSDAGVPTQPEPLPANVRVVERGDYTWVTNVTGNDLALDLPDDASILHGEEIVPEYDFVIVESSATDVSVSRR